MQDNGVKLVDPHGEMLTASWEAYATLLANATTEDALISALNEIITATKIDLSTPCTVIYGYDTRPSCPALIAALEDGLDAAGATKLVAGLVTTPQLHYLVRCHKTIGTPEAYGEPTIAGYYAKLATAYKTLAVRPLLSPALEINLIQLIKTERSHGTFDAPHGRLRQRRRCSQAQGVPRRDRLGRPPSPHHSRRHYDSWRAQLPIRR